MKKVFKLSPRALKLSILFGLICSIFLSFAHFNVACDDLRTNVLRLHIIANSDYAYDQMLKLKIRDAVLEESVDLFENTTTLEQAVKRANEQMPQLLRVAENTVRENGFDYKVKIALCDTYFETREYDTFTLPAGEYPSLVITVGEGRGKNWWCVIFPEVCISASKKSSLSQTVGREGSNIAENPKKYIIRFKAVEIYENLKKLLEF